ncbi:MAG: GNAT family N-acetyltransferase [Gammaproteobacteria bacterium]
MIDFEPSFQQCNFRKVALLAGFLQLTFIPGSTYTGRSRALIEGLRVNATLRGQGTGQALVNEAIQLAREAGCCMVQLTSNKQRTDALRFYESLGFVHSHEGMKLHLD